MRPSDDEYNNLCVCACVTPSTRVKWVKMGTHIQYQECVRNANMHTVNERRESGRKGRTHARARIECILLCNRMYTLRTFIS